MPHTEEGGVHYTPTTKEGGVHNTEEGNVHYTSRTVEDRGCIMQTSHRIQRKMVYTTNLTQKTHRGSLYYTPHTLMHTTQSTHSRVGYTTHRIGMFGCELV